MLLPAWRLTSRLARPLVEHFLQRRRMAGKEHAERWPERLGIDPSERPDGALVWLHAASVGESLSVLPLLEALRTTRPDLNLLVTTGTVTSASLMAKRLPDGIMHRFAPVDLPDVVDRFLGHWRPDLALMVESEIWPNMLSTLAVRRVPAVLLNARMSERSFRRWRWMKRTVETLLTSFDLVLAQSEADAGRLRLLGARNILTPGNLKFAAPPLPADPVQLDKARQELADLPVWLAASTHAGEEELAGRVHQALAQAHPDLVTLIVPRHPHRGEGITKALADQCLSVQQRSKGGSISAGSIHLADTMGELGLFYRLCPTVFVGGSLVPHGGQNPLEPARLGCAIATGPHMWNFAEIVADLSNAGGVVQVADESALIGYVADLLTNRNRRRQIGEAALRFALDRAGVLDRTLEALAPVLPPCR